MKIARAAAQRVDGFEQLLFIADRAIGEEHDLPDIVGIADVVGQRGPHRRHHFGAAFGLQRADECGGAANVLPVGRHGPREQHVHGVIEPDHVEAVVGLQAAERVDEAGFGLDDRDAAHRAGIVDHEDHLAGQRLLLGLLDRGRRDEGQQVVAVADALAEQPDRWRLFGRGLPGQLEIAIRRHRAFGKPDNARAGIGLFGLHRVMVALDLAERKARLQAHSDAGWIDRRVGRGVQHFRRDAVAVRNGIGFDRTPAAAIGPEVDALHDGNGIVAGGDHHRHPQRELVAGLLNRFLIFDLHQNGFAGADIGDGVGEDVRPFLFGQRRLLSILLRLFVDDRRLLPLLDVADHDAVADHHLQRIDRAA